jgi:hypothetical protein
MSSSSSATAPGGGAGGGGGGAGGKCPSCFVGLCKKHPRQDHGASRVAGQNHHFRSR